MMSKKLLLAALAICLGTGTTIGEEYPFPQNFKFPYGFMPSTFKTANFESWYTKYKSQNHLLIDCNGGIRTGSENTNTTKVESMGWAMIIAAYMGDKTDFDGLYKYYKSKLQNHGMMAWQTNCGGIISSGSASDGDLDVAFSLVVASWQWGGTYKDEAIKTIKTVKKLITNCSGSSVVMGGAGYGGCNETDISYYTPAFFRAFAEISGDEAWTKLADDTYTVLNNGANSNTGLVPDWQNFNGGNASGGRNHSYAYDACRVPWRMALDYLWNGNEKAHAWCKKISDWAFKIGPKNIKAGYTLEGSPTSSYHNMSFTGGFAVAAMCNSQEIADAFGEELARMSFDTYWYHAFLGTCYMMTMTGNMWHPSLKTGVAASNGNNVSAAQQPGIISVKKLTGRKLAVSGVSKGGSIVLSTLNGQVAATATASSGSDALLNVASYKSGCYMVTIRDKHGVFQTGRIVTIY
jgi:endo-1,4-beta-D-glucanase Y